MTSPKIAILVVAYNAEDTLHHVLDRIPTEFAQRVSVVLVCDDASTDSTHSQALKYQQVSKLPLNIVRHAANLGYGGNPYGPAGKSKSNSKSKRPSARDTP